MHLDLEVQQAQPVTQAPPREELARLGQEQLAHPHPPQEAGAPLLGEEELLRGGDGGGEAVTRTQRAWLAYCGDNE